MRISPTYEDLALRLAADASSDNFRVDLLRSPAGSCRPAVSALPFTEQQLPAVLTGLEQTVRGSGPAGSLTGRDMSPLPPRDGSVAIKPETVGQKLYEALFPGALGGNLQSSLGLLHGRGATGLRLRLVLDPEQPGPLTAFPWELLYRAEAREFLGRQDFTPIVRHLEVPRPALTLPPLSTLRILVVLSNPIGPPQLNVEREKELIQNALGKTPGMQLRFLDHPTGDRLRQRVRDEPFDVLHFVGHGGFESGEGVLLFEDDARYPAPMTGRVVADTLKSFTQLRLVFLNACETAQLPRADTGLDPYTGVAASLVMSGVPAVIGMQFPISDRAALKFSDAFYSNIAAGDPLESAVAEGRQAIYRDRPAAWEWATPVLFLGLPNGNLFQAAPPEAPAPAAPAPTPPSTPAPVAAGAPDLAEALDILDHQRYDEAVTALEKLKDAAPKNPDVSYYLALARLQGRRPRSARLDVIKRVEADLHRAHHLTEGERGAHLYLLQALIKFDFYRYNGMRIQPPTIEELLADARNAPADPEALGRLLTHAAPPPGPVRQAIEERLASA